MQRAKYDIGEEAVHRFQLPPEDKATLELAEWVDGAFRKASVCSQFAVFCLSCKGKYHFLHFLLISLLKSR